MFTDEEKQIIEFGKQEGKSAAEVKKALAQYRQSTGWQPPQTQEPQKSTVGSRVSNVIQQQGGKISSAILGQDEYAGRSSIRRGFEAASELMASPREVALATLPEAAAETGGKALGVIGKPFAWGFNKAKQGIDALGGLIGEIPALQKWATENPEAADAVYKLAEETQGTAKAAGTIAGDVMLLNEATKGLQALSNKAGTGKVTGYDLENLPRDVKGQIKATQAALASPMDDAARASVDRHLTSANQSLSSIDDATLQSLGGEKALIKQTHTNIVDGLKGSGDDLASQRIAQLNPDDYQTLQAYTDAVRKTTEGGSVRAFIESKSELLKDKFAGKPKDLKGTVAEVTQGKADDLAKSTEGLKTMVKEGGLDTSKVKTYKDLAASTDDTIKSLSEKMDDLLAKDTRPLTPFEAGLRANINGNVVIQSPVNDALEQLAKFYEKTGNATKLEEINQIAAKFQNQGLTLNEINNIAKLHGMELNAYNANGKLASGLTKQAAENTRMGVKDVVRQSLDGDAAKALDAQISSVIKVRDLADDMVEKVAKLEQRISERGLLEKLGYSAVKTADVLSGGAIRGIMGGLLPRGVGYKVMNALDLQEKLQKNLQLIEKALKAGSNAEVISAVKQIQKASSVTDDVASAADFFAKKSLTQRATEALKDQRGALNPKQGLKANPFESLNYNTLSSKGEQLVRKFLNHMDGTKKLPASEWKTVQADIQTLADAAGLKSSFGTNAAIAKELANKYQKYIANWEKR